MKTKFLSIIILSISFISCNQSTSPNYKTQASPYSGMWSVKLSGDITGAATLPVDEKGIINNGIPAFYFDSLEIITYLNSGIQSNGDFKSDFYCSKTFRYNNIVSNIYSTAGNFIGSFKDSTASGNYDITLNNNFHFNGTWSAKKFKL